MEIIPIEQFVRENVSRFELAGKRGRRQYFNLYNKKDNYCGEFGSYGSSVFLYNRYGIYAPINVLNLFNNNNGKLNQIMQKVVIQKKDNVEVKDHTQEIPVNAIPRIITTITTYLDFINDRFQTIKRESVLQNDLVRIGENDPDFYYNEDHVIYEELTEKPVYEQKIEVIREGSISKAKEEAQRHPFEKQICPGIPFIFW